MDVWEAPCRAYDLIDMTLRALNHQLDLFTSKALILKAVDELILRHGISTPTRAVLGQFFDTAQLMDLVLRDAVSKRIEHLTDQ